MNDTTKIVTDSIAAVQHQVAQAVNNTPTSLGDMFHSIAPFVYFLGAVILFVAAYLLWDRKRD